jgi:fructokinase
VVRVGIDLGGTKIEAIGLDGGGKELFRRRVPSPRGVYEHTVDALVGLVEEAEKALGEKASVGIGIPGMLSRATGLVKNANSTWLIGRPLKADLERRLGREVRIENDANCFALSEAVDGAGRGARVVFGVILGTGVGGGIAVDGRVLQGINAIGGEWGHNPLPLPTGADLPLRECYCGRLGCIETYLCGPARETDGDDARYAERLARSLGLVVNILDPDVIVLGGGVSNVESLYSEVPKLWGRYIFSDRVDTRLAKNAHGDSSGVRGAAWLWGR